MKFFVLLLIMLVSSTTDAQQLFYKNEAVDTIIISSNNAAYQFDDHGTTRGTFDRYTIVYDSLQSYYTATGFEHTTYTTTFSPRASKEKKYCQPQKKPVGNDKVSWLIQSLEKTYSPPQFGTLGISEADFYAATSEKQIRRIARRCNADWHFNQKYTTKEQNATFFNDCARIDTFNVFLQTAFDTTGYPIITDYDDHFEVKIVTQHNHYSFEAKYPNTFKQPWYFMAGNSVMEVSPVLNFGINSALCSLLPENFSRISTLKNEALFDQYILWCLKRQNYLD